MSNELMRGPFFCLLICYGNEPFNLATAHVRKVIVNSGFRLQREWSVEWQ